uniref:Uncharacterized protein n=1 Tax=Pithovirus LCPAC404 TaxID=2506597 RepID=A0A481ZC64_9VIRU|nr:MAG: uncharacterized protein LCPAC404_02370 [Pithovirus LCPAC404]
MIRVGTRKYHKGGKFTDPSIEGFAPVVVLTKSTEYGSLGPYKIKKNGKIFENIWQFSKVYPSVPEVVQRYSRWDRRVIWQCPAQQHVNNNCISSKYLEWRYAGMACQDAIRYPVGYDRKMRASCIGCLTDQALEEMKYEHNTKIDNGKLLDYVESRKKLYLPLYCHLVKKEKQYCDLQDMLKAGVNLLIIEVDACIQSSLPYYKEKYGVGDDFIENDTMLVNVKNLKIMLNDTKHPYGHGYCLGAALLGIDKEIVL